jgi:hypothetical protein
MPIYYLFKESNRGERRQVLRQGLTKTSLDLRS